jgi:hypothetical protein
VLYVLIFRPASWMIPYILRRYDTSIHAINARGSHGREKKEKRKETYPDNQSASPLSPVASHEWGTQGKRSRPICFFLPKTRTKPPESLGGALELVDSMAGSSTAPSRVCRMVVNVKDSALVQHWFPGARGTVLRCWAPFVPVGPKW